MVRDWGIRIGELIHTHDFLSRMVGGRRIGVGLLGAELEGAKSPGEGGGEASWFQWPGL